MDTPTRDVRILRWQRVLDIRLLRVALCLLRSWVFIVMLLVDNRRFCHMMELYWAQFWISRIFVFFYLNQLMIRVLRTSSAVQITCKTWFLVFFFNQNNKHHGMESIFSLLYFVRLRCCALLWLSSYFIIVYWRKCSTVYICFSLDAHPICVFISIKGSSHFTLETYALHASHSVSNEFSVSFLMVFSFFYSAFKLSYEAVALLFNFKVGWKCLKSLELLLLWNAPEILKHTHFDCAQAILRFFTTFIHRKYSMFSLPFFHIVTTAFVLEYFAENTFYCAWFGHLTAFCFPVAIVNTHWHHHRSSYIISQWAQA